MLNFASLRNLCGISLVAFALAVPAISRAQSGYTITGLRVLNSTYSVGYSINNNGQVAGLYGAPAIFSTARAALWTNGVGVEISPANSTGDVAYGINAGGQVTGFATNSVSQYAYRRDNSGSQILPNIGSPVSVGYAINASGQSTGYSTTIFDRQFAVRWTGTTVQSLGTLGGRSSRGLGINDSGQVAGYSDINGDPSTEAVRWTGTTAEDLGSLDGSGSSGAAINNSGQVAGYSFLGGANVYHAVRWTGTSIEDLGTLGGTVSKAYSINASGAVVGFSKTKGNVTHAFLTKGSTMLDLNSMLPVNSGWELIDAYGINDNGWITGQGIINGETRAFVLRPNAVPEPSALVVFGIGAMAITAGRRRRR